MECGDTGRFCYLMTDNEDVEIRGCDISEEVPAHYRAGAGKENKRCFHFNDGKNKRCLCNYDHCSENISCSPPQSPGNSLMSQPLLPISGLEALQNIPSNSDLTLPCYFTSHCTGITSATFLNMRSDLTESLY